MAPRKPTVTPPDERKRPDGSVTPAETVHVFDKSDGNRRKRILASEYDPEIHRASRSLVTVRVINKGKKRGSKLADERVINRSEFDGELHEEVGPAVEATFASTTGGNAE